MIPIDSNFELILNDDDLCEIDTRRLSDIGAFKRFAQGLSVGQDFVLNDRWQQAPASDDLLGTFNFVMHEMLPLAYDPAALEAMGGSFALRIIGVADYVMIAINHRVVVLSGLPTDPASGDPVIDLEIAPEIFLGYARGVLLGVAEEALNVDDEDEDRLVSDAELLLYGLPMGGAAPELGQKLTFTDVPDRLSAPLQEVMLGSLKVTQYNTGGEYGVLVETPDGSQYYLKDAIFSEGNGFLQIDQVTETGVARVAVYDYQSGDADMGALSRYETVVCLGRAAAETGSDGSCAGNLSTCGANEGIGSVCGANLGACGAAASGVGGCGANVGNCAANASGSGWCVQNLGACAANASGIGGCAANTGACGADVSGIGGCGANAGACAAKASGIGGCGANASACAANAGGIGSCGANASACAANLKLPCAAYAVYCVIDAGSVADAGACLINVIPILPSC